MVEDLDREPIGRKAGMTSGATTQREGVGEKVRENWQQFRGKVRQKWNQLTDNDLDTYQNRPRNDLVGYIGEKTGNERTMIERDVDTFAKDTNYKWP